MSVIDEVASLVARNRELEDEVRRLRSGNVDAERFYNVAMTTNMVAALHSVSPALVRKYIHLGMIETHPNSTDAKMLVRGSDALRLDFRKMKFAAKEGGNKTNKFNTYEKNNVK